MSLRLALVEPLAQPGAFAALAQQVPPDWMARADLDDAVHVLKRDPVLAMRIARTPRDAAMAGSAALLADIGALLPGSLLNAPPLPGELGRLAPRSSLLGAGLMARWGLPMEMVEAVAFHHRPSMLRDRRQDVVASVHFARALVDAVALDDEYVADAKVEVQLAG